MLICQPVDTAYYYTHNVYCSVAIKGTPWIIVWATTISEFISQCYADSRVMRWVQRHVTGLVFTVLD